MENQIISILKMCFVQTNYSKSCNFCIYIFVFIGESVLLGPFYNFIEISQTTIFDLSRKIQGIKTHTKWKNLDPLGLLKCIFNQLEY